MEWREYIPTDLSAEQRKGLSEIARDIGQVSLASVVIPAFIPSVEFSLLGFGFVAMFAFWGISIILVRNL
ncbi:MAG TPA: hypothetical protein VGA53_04865 [Candidatus Paceibacterota bacterium]